MNARKAIDPDERSRGTPQRLPPPCIMDHALLARLSRTIQRQTLLQASAAFASRMNERTRHDSRHLLEFGQVLLRRGKQIFGYRAHAGPCVRRAPQMRQSRPQTSRRQPNPCPSRCTGIPGLRPLELRAAGCATVLEEHASGADRSRPVLAARDPPRRNPSGSIAWPARSAISSRSSSNSKPLARISAACATRSTPPRRRACSRCRCWVPSPSLSGR